MAFLKLLRVQLHFFLTQYAIFQLSNSPTVSSVHLRLYITPYICMYQYTSYPHSLSHCIYLPHDRFSSSFPFIYITHNHLLHPFRTHPFHRPLSQNVILNIFIHSLFYPVSPSRIIFHSCLLFSPYIQILKKNPFPAHSLYVILILHTHVSLPHIRIS